MTMVRADDTSGGGPPAPDAEAQPALSYEIVDTRFDKRAAAPNLSFRLALGDTSGRRIYTVALTVRIAIEPAKRSYDDETRERLVDLFGEPERWPSTTRPLAWATTSALTPSFVGSAECDLRIDCTYDLELAAARYFYSLHEGVVPLGFHFNGTIFYADAAGALKLRPVPWSANATYRMPVSTWRRMMGYYYPHRRWLSLSDDTFDRLLRFRSRAALPTFDAALAALLEGQERRRLAGDGRDPEQGATP